jgi:cytochrome P450
MKTVDFDPYSAAFRENPYTHYATLRRKTPVVYVERLGAWVVSRYSDVSQVLKSTREFSSSLMADADPVLLGADPPAHTRNRAIMSVHFTPKYISAFEGRIRKIAANLISEFSSRGSLDLVSDFAGPLPVIVIAEMLGIDASDHARFRSWSDAVVTGITETTSEADRAEIIQQVSEFHDFFESFISQPRNDSPHEIINALLRPESTPTLTRKEVSAFGKILFVAGNATTTNLIGNAMLTLLASREALAAVQADASLIPRMIEESLRYDAPVQAVLRRATQDCEVGGARIKRGSVVMALIGSANRDEEHFPDPDRFDLNRNPQGHLAFGYGPHFCIGAPLARLEATVALELLLPRLRNPRVLDQKIQYIEAKHLRGPKSLRMSFDPA